MFQFHLTLITDHWLCDFIRTKFAKNIACQTMSNIYVENNYRNLACASIIASHDVALPNFVCSFMRLG
jgi:hypothetical protein